MDFLKTRYTQMNRRRRIYEGKAKVLYEGPEPGTLIQHFKDDATAFNAKKHEVIDGKGVLNNRISEYIFQHLNDIGVPTHFIRRLNMREQLIREVEIIPLEVVVRNVAAGSLATRLGIEEGTQLPRSIIEFYYKNDALNDPDGVGRAHHRLRLGHAAGDRRHHGAGHPGQRLPVRPLPRRRHPPRRLQDGMRPPLGRRHDAHRRRRRDLPRRCRLWDIKSNDKLDKDRFRRDMGGLVEAYTEVARRLGIIAENERVTTVRAQAGAVGRIRLIYFGRGPCGPVSFHDPASLRPPGTAFDRRSPPFRRRRSRARFVWLPFLHNRGRFDAAPERSQG